MAKSMLEYPADESFARAVYEAATPSSHESLAAMSLSSLLYYVLVGDGRLTDESA